MRRRGVTWITNIGHGGRAEPAPATGRLAELAVAAAAAVGADHAGVDLIVDRDGGLQILEVNSMPAWQGLQAVSQRGHRRATGTSSRRRRRPELRAAV